MNEQISWDHSLVKKYSSSNHFKLLTQLKTEIEKYPLIRKKKISSDITNDNKKFETKNYLSNSNSEDLSNDNNSNINKELNNIDKSTVSFNNSKNFSIYKNITKDNVNEQEEINLYSENSIEHQITSTFKDRLNQIDMK